MAVNTGVMVWERRRGEALESEILVADSLHTASDILSSLAVLVGLAAVAAGYPLLDPVVGVLIAGFIGHTGVLVLKEVSRSLSDRARIDADAAKHSFRKTAALNSSPGLASVTRFPNNTFSSRA